MVFQNHPFSRSKNKGEKQMFYYDHDITVKITDGLLEHSQDWDWFIQHVEENFLPDLTVDSFESAIEKYNSVYHTLNFLCKINEVLDGELNFSKEWLSNLNKIALFYNGALKLNELNFKDDFFNTTTILVYLGKVYSVGKREKYLTYRDVLMFDNLFQIEDLSEFEQEKEALTNLMNQVSYDMSVQISVFKRNIHKIEKSYDGTFLNGHSDTILNANCFSCQGIETKSITTWQEKYISDMLKTSFRDGKLIPLVTFSSSSYPDFTLWTSDVYCQIKKYFNSDIANFIVESIDFALNNDNIPSPETINKHFELFTSYVREKIKTKNGYFYCSSLEFIIAFINNKEAFNLASSESKKQYSVVLEELYKTGDINFLLRLNRKKSLLNNLIKSKLQTELQVRADNVNNISTYAELYSYIEDKDILYLIEQKHIETLSEKFNEIIKSCSDIRVASLFYSYFLFLLNIKNNKNVNSSSIKEEIIRIRKLWQNEYYSISRASMTIVSTKAIPIKTEILKCFTTSILLNPIKFAADRVKLHTNQMIDAMTLISSHALMTAVDRMVITEDFPHKRFFSIDEKHPIDQIYASLVDGLIEKNRYKFLNNLDTNTYMQQLYERITQELSLSVGMLIDIEPLYNAVINQNPNYNFLEYEENIKLGHLTQLFPILENKIRDFGEMCGIVRVCESKDLCHRLKEPDYILYDIIKAVYDETKSLLNIADLFFIHFCMFAENGCNIRNECVHGKNFSKGSELSFAFKLTLISLYMVGYRCQAVLENIGQ